MILTLNLVLVAVSQYDSQLGLTNSVSDLQRERASEGPVITDVRVNNARLNVTVTNSGKLPLVLTTLWATQWNPTGTETEWHQSFSIDPPLYLAPGNIKTNIGQTLSQIFDQTRIYNVKVVTTRGNIASGSYVPMAGRIAPGFVNTGYLTIAFSDDAFKYTRPNSPTLYTAWDPPSTDSCVVWRVQFVNHGAQDIWLYKFSVMSFVQVAISANQIQFFIVDQNVQYVTGCAHQDNVPAYSDLSQVVPRNIQGDTQAGGSPVWVKFSAQGAGGTNPQSASWGSGTEYVVFIVMFYRYGPSQDYTQIIPFAGVHFA